jgi:hypothetical protein
LDGALRLCPGLCERMGEGVCGKPHAKCGECRNQVFIPVSDAVVARHLTAERGPHGEAVRRLRDGGLCVAAR